jgi:hypothetical protein
MKTLLSILFVAISTSFISCSNNNTTRNNSETNTDTSSQAPTINNNNAEKNEVAINNIISGYLSLKNALTDDNGSKAASSAKEMGDALKRVDESSLTTDQKKIYDDVKDDIKEHAEHIGDNASNIEHQREHFDLLSKDIIDLIKATGSSQTLYKDFCPMYNNKKGALWLSESKEIKNPYYGKKMPKCGELKEEIKPKG